MGNTGKTVGMAMPRMTAQQMRLFELTRGLPEEAMEDVIRAAARKGDDRGSTTNSGALPSSHPDSETQSMASTEVSSANTMRRYGTLRYGFVGSKRESPIAPFVPHLALRSFQLTLQDEPVVVPCTVQAALLFVDISGYSKMTKALESRGPFALFDVVNGYVVRILDVVVGHYKGEVLKFAGDAVLCVWYGADLAKSVRAAAHCAVDLQRVCGEHAVPGTDLALRIHIGLTCGTIRSQVLRTAMARYMENHFHFITGEPVNELAAVVDLAKSGETCATKTAVQHICAGADLTPVAGRRGMMLIEDFPPRCGCAWSKNRAKVDAVAAKHTPAAAGGATADTAPPSRLVSPLVAGAEPEESDSGTDRDLDEVEAEEEWVEDAEHRAENTEKFIHPVVRRKLKLGLLQSQLAELRLLTVLFIRKTDDAIDVADWFAEVQRVIDDFRCPILQVIDDDKGVHIVAAVNLFTADREPAVTGIQLAKALLGRQAGCTIGLASGVTFCGVVGSSHASRWDMTGAACVRACRLMQEALRRGEPVLVDESVSRFAGDESLLVPRGEAVLKGSAEPVKLLGLNGVDMTILSSIISATRMCPAVHVEQVEAIRSGVVEDRAKQRHAVVVHGCGGGGKACVCVRAVFRTGVVPLVHTTVENSPTLDVARTLARWFAYHKNAEVAGAARRVQEALAIEHNIRATTLALELVNLTVAKGLKTALVVRQAQSLDQTSLSFLRQAVDDLSEGKGRFLVFLTVVPSFGLISPWSMQGMFASGATLVPVGDLCATEAAALAEFCFGYKVAPALTRAILAKSGRVARCVAQLVAHIEQRGGDMTTVSPAGIISARTLPLREMLARSWTVVSPAVSSQAAQRLDMLTPAAQTVLKVIACLSTPYAPVTRALAIALTTRILSTSSPATVRKDIALLQDIDILARVDTDKFFLAAAAGPDDHTYDAKNVSSPAGTYEHSTRQNFYCDENDHEGFKIVNPTLHDVVLSVTLAEQRKQVCKMAASLVVEEHATAIPAYLFAFAHFNFHGGNLDMFRRLITKGWADLKSTTEQDQKLRTAIVQFVAQDLFEKGLTADDVGINLSDLDPDYQHDAGHEDDHGSPVSSPAGSAAAGQPKIAKSVVACKNFLPPLSLGFLTMALRQTARTLYNLATKVAAGDQVPDEELASTRKFVAGYIKHTKRLDAAVEYFPIVRDEAALFAQWLAPPADVASATRNAAEFLEYMQSVVRRRVELYEQYLRERMSLPEAPADPLWAGPERQALEHAMSNTLAAWPRSDVAAVRDGLMEMATQGWLPLNPDLTLEFQRDVYVRRRIQEPFCFLCFLYVNLSLHKDP